MSILVLAGDIVSVSEIIKQAMAEKGVQQKDVAAHMGWSPQNFANRLRNNTVDADEWVEIAKFIGYEIKMVGSDGVTMEEKKKGIGQRVTQMVDGVIYDTDKAEAICHTNEFADSFFELYKRNDGSMFIVLYAKWMHGAGTIMPVEDSDAERFISICK